MKDHSYEEIRAVALDILAERVTVKYTQDINQLGHLEYAVAEILCLRDEPGVDILERFARGNPRLSEHDRPLLSEVFWNLFREGIITLGLANANPDHFPYFRLSHVGKKILANEHVYFFHDVSTYESLIRQQIPAIDSTTLVYLKEAMQAFRSGCILSATVMLGVAAEHTFETLLDVLEANPTHAVTFAPVFKERNALTKMTKLWGILSPTLKTLPYPIREDLEIQFPGIQNLIRIFRNESGHPTGKIIDREQCYVLLNLYIPYAKKMHQLMDHFG